MPYFLIIETWSSVQLREETECYVLHLFIFISLFNRPMKHMQRPIIVRILQSSGV
jgi:hypothetical protein